MPDSFSRASLGFRSANSSMLVSLTRGSLCCVVGVEVAGLTCEAELDLSVLYFTGMNHPKVRAQKSSRPKWYPRICANGASALMYAATRKRPGSYSTHPV